MPATGCVQVNNAAPCDDGNACTTSDSCSGGVCVGGVAPDCNDGNVCTTDSCVPATGCVQVNNAAPCDDGNACTTADTCSGGVCVGGVAPNCDDGNVCTTDSCVPATGCVQVNNAAPCDDGSACTTSDTCSGGVCVGGAPPNCNDGNVCTTDSCAPAVGCVNAVNTVACDDGDACTTTDTCSGGVCVGGVTPDCDDGNLCTTDSCAPATGCVNANDTAACDDGDACTTADTCTGGVCVGGAPPNCDDGNLCTSDSCLPATGCVNASNTLACDDGDACTTADSCSGGVCAGGVTLDCDDGNVCTTDSCAPATGCVHVDNTVACDDGNACTTADSCGGGVCEGGAPPNCDDGNVCTDDSCAPATGCVHADNTLACSDGSVCTTSDACSGGVCVGGAPIHCDDGNVCTTDSCAPTTGCKHTNNTLACDDDDACTTADTCSGGHCLGMGSRSCDDGNVCTDDPCDEVDGCVYFPSPGPCSDGDACTSGDSCASMACAPGTPVVCEDGVACTADSCAPASGCAYTPQDAACDDDEPCTLDTCGLGGCSHEAVADHTPCDDGDPTTHGDTCEAGVCAGSPDPCDDPGIAYDIPLTSSCPAGCSAGDLPDWDVVEVGTNGPSHNQWYVSLAEGAMAPGTCGGSGDEATLHVGHAPLSPDGACPLGDCGATYDDSPDAETHLRLQTAPMEVHASCGRVWVDFFASASEGDGASLVYSLDGGTTWHPLVATLESSCCCADPVACTPLETDVPCAGSASSGQWTRVTADLPPEAHGAPDLRLGLLWQNDGGSTPATVSFAVARVRVTASPAPP
ncbi:MAG: hypothetical protein AMXMBFR64_30750 [Myxococcales bacterium]